MHFPDDGSSSIKHTNQVNILEQPIPAKRLRKKGAVAGEFDPNAAARSSLHHIVHIEKKMRERRHGRSPSLPQPRCRLLPYSLGPPLCLFDLFRHLTFGLALVLSCRVFHLLFCGRFHIARTLACAGGGLCGRSFRIGQFLFQFLLHIPWLRLTLSGAEGRHPDEADQADH